MKFPCFSSEQSLRLWRDKKYESREKHLQPCDECTDDFGFKTRMKKEGRCVYQELTKEEKEKIREIIKKVA